MALSRSSVFRVRHRAILAAAPTLVMAAGIMLSSGAAVRAQDATPAATLGIVEAQEALPECGTSELGMLPADTEAAAIYSVVPEESEARYRVQEELAQVGETEAIGKTQAIIGQIGFDADGMPVPCARFDIDLRTLQSDQAKRDNYLYNNTLEAETFPLATFVLRQVEGMDAPLADGQEATVTLVGDLTLKDVTKLVAWEATVTREGDALTGQAATEFEMPDFSLETPSVPVLLSIDETIRLEFDITARPQA